MSQEAATGKDRARSVWVSMLGNEGWIGVTEYTVGKLMKLTFHFILMTSEALSHDIKP